MSPLASCGAYIICLSPIGISAHDLDQPPPTACPHHCSLGPIPFPDWGACPYLLPLILPIPERVASLLASAQPWWKTRSTADQRLQSQLWPQDIRSAVHSGYLVSAVLLCCKPGFPKVLRVSPKTSVILRFYSQGHGRFSFPNERLRDPHVGRGGALRI